MKSLETDESFEYECKVVVMCVGNLGDPAPNNIPGAENFQGTIMHTGKWDTNVDITDKRLAVVGNGPSATQLVPAVQKKVKSLHHFIRASIFDF